MNNIGNFRHSKSLLEERSIDDALTHGLGTGVMSRKRALRLLGGALLGGMLVPMTGTNAVAAAKVNWKAVGNVLSAVNTAFTIGSGLYDAAKKVLDLNEEEKKEVAHYSFDTYYVGAHPIPTVSSDVSHDNSSSTNSNSIRSFTIDDLYDRYTVLTPEEAAAQAERQIALARGEEKTAYEKLAAYIPEETPDDTWFTARLRLQELYPRLSAHDWSMMQAFYYTQYALSIPYSSNWRDYQDYRYTADDYINYFAEYGWWAQRENNIQPQLTPFGMESKAKEAYKYLNNNYWPLDWLSPREAWTLAWAMYLS